ncbi:hypothetical protein KA005_51695 [bacterium]|nr:hypothetical protein [bacterium]
MSVFRLDYIGNFKDGTVDIMSETRLKFLKMEHEIENIYKLGEATEKHREYNFSRVYQKALECNEMAQMYSIKLLCLLGEKK